MHKIDGRNFKYSWEKAIEILRQDPAHQELIFNSYLTSDLLENCRRFSEGEEFAEVLQVLNQYAPGKKTLLDMPAGNGIATYSFAKAGFKVTAVEPDASKSVGRGAIAHVLQLSGLQAEIVAAFGEKLPFASCSFDLVYVRQGLHHASDLSRMLAEIARVVRPGGVLLACREHVVDNYGASLKAFLDSQVDQQLYGGEHAFTLPDYQAAIVAAGLESLIVLGPFDSIINMFPNTPEVLRAKILQSVPGRVLRTVLPDRSVAGIGLWWLRTKTTPGRLHSFVATKRVVPSQC